MKLLKKDNKGFTLTELIIVIVIIGILAAVLIPSLTGYVQKARISAAEQEATAIYSVFKSYKTEQEAGSLKPANKSFKDYYLEIAGEPLLLQEDSTENLGWKEATGNAVLIDQTNITYFYSFAHENGYNVYLDQEGNVLGASKR